MMKYVLITLVAGMLFPAPGFTLEFYTTYYVNGSTGSDTIPCGQQKNTACKTIKKALNNLPAGGGKFYIKLTQGVYQESNMDIWEDYDIIIDGGWDSSYVTQICDPSNTNITTGNQGNSFYDMLFRLDPSIQKKTALDIRCLSLVKVPTSEIKRAVNVYARNGTTVKLSLNKVRITGFTGQDILALFIPSTAWLATINASLQEVVFNKIPAIWW